MTHLPSPRAAPAVRPAPPPSITILMNVGSGALDKAPVRTQLVEVLAGAGHAVDVVALEGGDFCAQCEPAVRAAARSGGLVVAAGGDGTVNQVAALCCRHGATMGVIPLGTFNYFARELGIPLDPVEAARLLLAGTARAVTVGEVNGRVFVNNASFGLYTHIIRNREADKSRFGRFRLVALLSAAATLLRGQRPFAIRTVVDGVVRLRRTLMVFVGNNTCQLNDNDLHVARSARADRLAVIVLKPVSRLEMARLLVRGALRTLNREDRLDMFGADEFVVESRRRHVEVAIDGELVRCRTPLRFRTLRNALTVLAAPEPAP